MNRKEEEKEKARNGIELGFCHGPSSSTSYRLNVNDEWISLETSEDAELCHRVDGKNRAGLCGPRRRQTHRS